MAQVQQPEYSPIHETSHHVEGSDENKDRGMLDFLEKKEEQKPNDEMSVPEFAEAHVLKSGEKKEEEEGEEGNIPISCSSTDENGENKGLKEKITRDEKEEQQHHKDGVVGGETEEKKSFMEKIKENLPSAPKKTDTDGESAPNKTNTDEESAPVDCLPAETDFPKNEPEEKKGLMEKIKDKLTLGNQKNGAAETREGD